MKVDFKIKTKMGIFTQVTKIKGQFQKKIETIEIGNEITTNMADRNLIYSLFPSLLLDLLG